MKNLIFAFATPAHLIARGAEDRSQESEDRREMLDAVFLNKNGPKSTFFGRPEDTPKAIPQLKTKN